MVIQAVRLGGRFGLSEDICLSFVFWNEMRRVAYPG